MEMEPVIEKKDSEINENNDQSLVAELKLNQTYLEEKILSLNEELQTLYEMMKNENKYNDLIKENSELKRKKEELSDELKTLKAGVIEALLDKEKIIESQNLKITELESNYSQAKEEAINAGLDKGILEKQISNMNQEFEKEMQLRDEKINSIENDYKEKLKENLKNEIAKKSEQFQVEQKVYIQQLQQEFEIEKKSIRLSFERKLREEKSTKEEEIEEYRVSFDEISKENEGLKTQLEQLQSNHNVIKDKYHMLQLMYEEEKVDSANNSPVTLSQKENEFLMRFSDLANTQKSLHSELFKIRKELRKSRPNSESLKIEGANFHLKGETGIFPQTNTENNYLSNPGDYTNRSVTERLSSEQIKEVLNFQSVPVKSTIQESLELTTLNTEINEEVKPKTKYDSNLNELEKVEEKYKKLFSKYNKIKKSFIEFRKREKSLLDEIDTLKNDKNLLIEKMSRSSNVTRTLPLLYSNTLVKLS